MEFRFLRGNIVDAKVDAIVLPANSHLKEGSGASEAIFEAAGRKELTKKCNEIGHCDVGFAVPTLGYNLDCKCIIHAVVPKWIDGEHDEYNLLSSAYVSSLKLADVMNCKSIAFPILAAGNNGFDAELALEIATRNIEEFTPENLEAVSIVVFGGKMAELIESKSYDVDVLPRDLERDKKEQRKRENKKKILNNVKDTARKFAEDQFQKGMDFIKDPDNQKKILDIGIQIVKSALEQRNQQKEK